MKDVLNEYNETLMELYKVVSRLNEGYGKILIKMQEELDKMKI